MVLSALAWQLSWLLEKRAYKLQYSAEIKEYSREFHVDPYLVAAVIHCESSNRHTVVSRAGAKGLMQIMPDTANYVCALYGMRYSENDLKKPEYNIRIGCKYLKYLSGKFTDENILIAYNAGEGNAKKWIESGKNVPFKETRDYVKRVVRARRLYAIKYGKI